MVIVLVIAGAYSNNTEWSLAAGDPADRARAANRSPPHVRAASVRVRAPARRATGGRDGHAGLASEPVPQLPPADGSTPQVRDKRPHKWGLV